MDYDPNDILTQAILDPEIRRLQQMGAFGQGLLNQQTAQGARVGGTYVASSPLEHLANGLRPILGALISRRAASGESDIGRQIAGQRQKYAGALSDAIAPSQAPPDMIAAPGMDQASQDHDRQSKLMQLGMMGSMSGDPQMAAAGKEALAMPGQTLSLALQRQRLTNEGPQAALDNATPDVFNALTKRKTEEANTQNWEHFANPITGEMYLINKKTGEAKPVAGAGGGPGSSYDKRLPTMQEKFAKDMDPNAFRSGVLKGNQERANAADRLLQLAVDPLTGGPANLTPQQMSELSTSLASLLSGGGAGSEGQRAELTPYTKGRSFANLMQWLTDKPQGAEQQAFVQQMIGTAKREKGVVEGQISKAQQQRLANHLQYLRTFPNEAKSQMEGYGIDPSAVDFQTGKFTPKQQAAAPAAPAGGPKQIGSDAEYEALPSGAEFVGPDGKHRRKP